MSSYLIDEIEAAANIERRPHSDGLRLRRRRQRSSTLTLRDARSGDEESRAGRRALRPDRRRARTPRGCPPEISRDDWGYLLTGPELPAGSWPLERPPLMLETSVPGVFAVGDARNGSTKRVASAVGEGSVVIEQVHQLFELEQEREFAR